MDKAIYLMCAKWVDETKSPGLVAALLTPIRNQFVIDGSGEVSGSNLGAYQEYESAIESYLKFNSEIPELDKNHVLGNAIWKAAKDKTLDAPNLLKYVGVEESAYLSKPKEKYEFVSSLSVGYFEGLNRTRLKPSIIFARKKPKKLDFQPLLSNFSYLGIPDIPASYSYFRIPVQARNVREAYLLGIDAVDLLRAIWNWYYKPKEYIFNTDRSRKPTNVITLGPFHTIVNPDGKLDAEFWYEPEFGEHSLDISESWNKLTAFERKSRISFSKHAYRAEIESAMRRFTRALDHTDKHVSFLQLWQVLEKITATTNANYEQLIKRVAFLYEDVDLTKGVLNHLRLYRNLSVHDGVQHHRIEKYLFQLKRYVEQVLAWHVKNPFKASSLTDAVSYLDLPPDGSVLREKLGQFKKAMKFRRVEDSMPPTLREEK